MERPGPGRPAEPDRNRSGGSAGGSEILVPLWLFFFLAVLAVISGLGVILQRNPVHCLLALAVTLIDNGVIFIGLGAVTIGLLQIIVYVGAIMVLFLFVIWLLNLQSEIGPTGHIVLKIVGVVGAAALAAER